MNDTPMMQASKPTDLPLWNCHKQVHAAQISSIIFDHDLAKEQGNRATDGSAILYFDGGQRAIHVNYEYVRKHKPEAGGYFVAYRDGYQSFSPAAAFEDGYTKV